MMRFNKVIKQIQKRRSEKATQHDPAENAQYRRQNTPRKKRRLHKRPRGGFYGKKWYPYNEG
jgi:hypothetical protein